jgi:hypothetical protein
MDWQSFLNLKRPPFLPGWDLLLRPTLRIKWYNAAAVRVTGLEDRLDDGVTNGAQRGMDGRVINIFVILCDQLKLVSVTKLKS